MTMKKKIVMMRYNYQIKRSFGNNKLQVKELSFSVKSEKGGKKKEKEDDKKKVVKGRLQPLPTKGWVHRKNQGIEWILY